ncbi:hypothetical protein R6258_03655 [Halomonas sp. HP20-15]|uniref:hypothetical protein n=1 Tax=Halomonas sp. HP20-15 TaxID=3085901 RepID=UPI0029810AC5|nr:hypothetical protein [Halomonas sp. HP20-15]MDW5376008.1 hypothetical protein [Halomonas sp. HP20-15]
MDVSKLLGKFMPEPSLRSGFVTGDGKRYSTYQESARMFKCFQQVVFAMAFLASSVCLAETYEEAEKKSEAASSNPALLEWYQTKMQPAFRNTVGQIIGKCLNQPPLERPARVDLVFVVTTSGKVGAIYWKEKTPFFSCLGTGIQSATFPPPPETDFYFGVGFGIPAKKAGQ